MLTYDRTKSGQAKYDILEENKQNEPQREPEPEKKSSILTYIAILLLILSLILTAAVAGLSIYNTVVIETQIIQMIKLINGSTSGLELIRDGTTVELYNTGVHSVVGIDGIIVDNTNSHNPIVSLNESSINCTGGNSSTPCVNTTTFVNTTEFFDCLTCLFNGTCDCFNNTIINQNLTIINITDNIYNNITLFTNQSCCTTLLTPGSFKDTSGPMGDQTISNTGVLNISVLTGLNQTGPANQPVLAVDFEAGTGISITGSLPMIFNNTGVLKIEAGQNVIVNSSNGDGTGVITISIPFQINNIFPGYGINITQDVNETIITNDGVVQNIPGIGIGITSSFGNGKGVVNITNTGVIQVLPGPGVNITGTNQFPIINFNAVQLNALAGIFINNTGNIFNIGNLGVLQINPGTSAITISPNPGTGVVNISVNCLQTISGGTGINVVTSGTTATISAKLAAGAGISISGAVISADLLAGSGISITGSNPLTISSTAAGGLIGTANVNVLNVAGGIWRVSLNDPGESFRAQLCTQWPRNIVPNCNIGSGGGACAGGFAWNCPLSGGNPATNNGCPSAFNLANAEYTVPFNGTYLISYSVEDTFSTTGASLMLMTSAPSCTRCSTGGSACTYTRLMTLGGINPIGSTFTDSTGGQFFRLQAGQILSLQQLYAVGWGNVDAFFVGNPSNGIVTYFSVYLLYRF